MTEQEWLEYVDKLTLQAALRQTIKQDPNSLKNPMMQDIYYIINDFDDKLYPEYRKVNPKSQILQQNQNNSFDLLQNTNPKQELTKNIMPINNLFSKINTKSIADNVQKNVFGNIPTKGIDNTLPQLNQQTTKPQSQYEVQQKVQEEDQTPKPFWDKYKDLKWYSQAQKVGSKLPVHSPAFQYYGISTKMADGEQPSKIAKKENSFYKLDDIKNQITKNDYINKATQMFGLDKNDPDLYEKVKNTKVVVPKVDSTLYNDIKNSEVTQRKVIEHYKKLKENSNKALDTNIIYNKSKFPLSKEGGLYNSIKKANLNRSKINNDGSFDTRMDDGYDFEYNKKEVNPLKDPSESLSKFINNNAHEQQQKGKLENYILSAPIHYSKEELEEILRKLGLY